jgi:hypothetical protein
MSDEVAPKLATAQGEGALLGARTLAGAIWLTVSCSGRTAESGATLGKAGVWPAIASYRATLVSSKRLAPLTVPWLVLWSPQLDVLRVAESIASITILVRAMFRSILSLLRNCTSTPDRKSSKSAQDMWLVAHGAVEGFQVGHVIELYDAAQHALGATRHLLRLK